MAESLDQAPDFPDHLTWINVDFPATLCGDLAGHVVVIHFWTASSVHCLHAATTFAYLTQRFAGRPFAVVGVHTGRAPAEELGEYVRCAVHRHSIRYAVVVDEERMIWDSYGCSAWPTTVLVDGDGYVRFKGPGEPDRHRFESAIDQLLQEAEAETHYLVQPFEVVPSPPAASPGLRGPTKLALHGDTLWVADTGNHRLVAFSRDSGRVAHVIGTGAPGAADGPATAASFFEPRGLAVAGDALYVADTGNHLIRAVDLESLTVTSVVGQHRPVGDVQGGRSGREQGISSPWGLCASGDQLFVAMAGAHQIWAIDLPHLTTRAYAGSGQAGSVDGALDEATLDQPTAVAATSEGLCFVDSAAGAVRTIDSSGKDVRTAAGIDAAGAQDLAVVGDEIWLACTFDSTVSRVDYDRAGLDVVARDLSGPAGVVADADGSLFVADTDAHRIVRVDRGTGDVTEFGEVDSLPSVPSQPHRVQSTRVRALGELTIGFNAPVPAGERVHPSVPAEVEWRDLAGEVFLTNSPVTAPHENERVVIGGLATLEGGEGRVEFIVRYVTCLDADSVCHVHERRFDVDLELSSDGSESIELG